MKKFLFPALIVGVCCSVKAQNVFPLTGNVGIGTTTPFSGSTWASPALEIAGARGALGLTTDVSGGIASVRFKGPSSEMHLNYISSSTDTDNLALYSYTTGGYIFAIKGNGNLGIGTSTPQEKLSVSGNLVKPIIGNNASHTPLYTGFDSQTNTVLEINNSSTPGSGFPGLVLSQNNAGSGSTLGTLSFVSSGTSATEKRGAIIASTLQASASSAITSDLSFYTNNSGSLTEKMKISADGNVGIGVATLPVGYKLAVNGNMIAESVKVKLNSAWPDYVFNKNYTLKPLSEVEQYIKANKHLSDIPPAAEVEKEGLNLGEMNAKLLKKIEELTLYIIDQNKRIEKLEAQKQ